jgi:hypothetical protein
MDVRSRGVTPTPLESPASQPTPRKRPKFVRKITPPPAARALRDMDRESVRSRIRTLSEPVDSGCWLWRGHVAAKTGYGRITILARVVEAHRASYVAFFAPIAAGMHIDHSCRVRACVNPEHLFAVTQAENNRRRWLRQAIAYAEGAKS